MIKKTIVLIFLIIMSLNFIACKKKRNVDESIKSFLDTYAQELVSNLDYQVIKAIKDLENSGYKVKLTDYITKEEIEEKLISFNLNTINDVYKYLVISKCFDLDYQILKIKILEFEECSIYEYAPYLIITKALNINTPLQTLILENITKEENNTDPDMASLNIIALKGYQKNTDNLINVIKENIRDNGVESYGIVNSSTTATSILALIEADYDSLVIDKLVNSLFAFKLNDGYKWRVGDDDIDLQFSTPQVFSALVSYKIYKNE